MAKKQIGFKTKGMNKDLSVSAFNPEFAFENMNLRLSTNEGNTLLSWVNEKGTALIETNLNISGIPIGTAVLNHTLVLFTVGTGDNKVDYIYKIYKGESNTEGQLTVELLYCKDLHFKLDKPLETSVSYEAETIQKVYWTDGENQPRVINIKGKYYTENNGERTYKPSFIFDFIPELQLEETVSVLKKLGANGMFAPGVIQYAFTYYNKYCQETNIFYTTPLYYISYADRGASPEDKVDNAFQITVEKVDENFEYLRIYSIQRTSINGTPIVKRIQDIEINGLDVDQSGNKKASYLDTGVSGDTVDPTELLYKGGNAIKAYTIEQKDDTLFLGNITDDISYALDAKDVSGLSVTGKDVNRTFTPLKVSDNNYVYANQLSATSGEKTVPCAGFKSGDVYRCGVQFQHKTGKWSAPTYIGNYQEKGNPVLNSDGSITVPTLKGTIQSTLYSTLTKKGYKRARAVVVYPSLQDRLSVCQGVACPTLFTDRQRDDDKNIYAQSSWFFRSGRVDAVSEAGTVAPVPGEYLEYTNRTMSSRGTDTKSRAGDGGASEETIIDWDEPQDEMNPDIEGGGSSTTSPYNPKSNIRQVEIQGSFDNKNRFKVDRNTVTLHSPDIEFDTQLAVADYSPFGYRKVGEATFTNTLSDINIQTETPVASSNGSGFTHKSFTDSGMLGIVSGLFYDDYLINDDNGSDSNIIGAYDGSRSSCRWMVYLWNKTGSLNNDIIRPTDKGVATAVLKKKVISNLRYSTSAITGGSTFTSTTNLQLFSSDEPTILKLDAGVYMGNIDTILNPDNSEGMYFVFNSDNIQEFNVKNAFISNSEKWWKTYYDEVKNGEVSPEGTLWRMEGNNWVEGWAGGEFFKTYRDCAVKKDMVRMKYKSTPHLVLSAESEDWWSNTNALPIIEVGRNINSDKYNSLFGGESMDALKENIWIPCGEPVSLKASGTDFYYEWGDTYYQRYDCLKTYAYTKEDENQVVEIGSFMLETRVNIDGRYDRNRGQLSNLNMSPQNFNLINPVYSQINNFFTYRIVDDSYYKNTEFPNQITWSKTKTAGADVDQWTNVTLASVLELDGDKGKLNKLIRLNDQLLAFQDTGISQILYNDNVQISSTDGVPIEIANSGKVQGKRYLSNTIGCSNKWSMATTPNGIYFMDSHDKGIYLFNGQLNNISNTGGFNTWCKKNIPLTKDGWKPDFSDKEFVAYYDKLNQDVLFINDEKALAWSEKLQAFTSFYDYGGIPFFCNLDDTGIWIKNGESGAELWKHQAGDYCRFFGENKPYWMTLVGNPEPQTDKIFTNLEFRACVQGDRTIKTIGDKTEFDKFLLPFDSLETWDEYQHGIAKLDTRTGHDLFKHHLDNTTGDGASVIRKFRMWRCDIPRDNTPKTSDQTEQAAEQNGYSLDTALGITRYSRKPQDRMRNPWIYLKLMKKAETGTHTVDGQEVPNTLPKAEVHDLIMTYFN